MPIVPIGTGDGNGEGSADDLADVTLEYFYANPTSIGPFDVSLLAWHVDGVKPRVRILLDNGEVAAAGQAVVQPAMTTSYMLSATAGNTRKALGHATVSVDRSTCEETEILNALVELRAQIILGVNEQSPQIYWSGNTADPSILSVTLSHDTPGRILIHAVVRQRIAWFSDPYVTFNLSFGLKIENGAFVAVAPESHASVKFDRLTWFLGGFLLGLALAINSANEKAKRAGFTIIDGLISILIWAACLPLILGNKHAPQSLSTGTANLSLDTSSVRWDTGAQPWY